MQPRLRAAYCRDSQRETGVSFPTFPKPSPSSGFPCFESFACFPSLQNYHRLDLFSNSRPPFPYNNTQYSTSFIDMDFYSRSHRKLGIGREKKDETVSYYIFFDGNLVLFYAACSFANGNSIQVDPVGAFKFSTSNNLEQSSELSVSHHFGINSESL